MSWTEILADKNTYGDDLKVNLNGKEFSVGDIRSYVAAEQKKLADEQRQIALKEGALKQQQLEVADLFGKVTSLQDELARQPKAPKNGEAYNYEADPILSPLHKQLSAKDEEINGLKNSLKSLGEQFNQTAGYMLDYKWRNDFNSIQDRSADVKYEDVLKYATEEKITDRAGVPDVKKAYDQMTAATRAAEKAKAEFERGKKEGLKDAMIASMSKPGSSSSLLPPSTQANKTFTSLDDAINAAKMDPDIVGALNGIDLNAVLSA